MKISEKKNMTPIKLGVTGGVGSGKSVVCDYLSGKGLTVISADDLSRRAVATGTTAYQDIVKYFGNAVVSDDGGLDRKTLRNIIARDPEKRKRLESFIHPEVFRLMAHEFESAAKRNEPVVVVEVPLLFELGLKSFFDITLTVCADKEVRIKRMMNRDQVSYKEAQALLGIQMPEEEKKRNSDFIIDNNGAKEELYKSMDNFYQKLVTQFNIT